MGKLNQQLTLRDGRRLGFAEYGVENGQPLFYFHGWPGSRIEPRAVECAEIGARVIAVDRPGYGLSDFQEQRRILDWPKDICELADTLRLKHFQVLGVSGGGPYAAVCAARLPQRVARVGLVCSVGPLDTPGAARDMVGMNRGLLFLARTTPRLVRLFAGPFIRAGWHYETEVLPRKMLARLPETDRRTLASPELRETLLASWSEAFRSGMRGMVWDGCLYAWSWGFQVEEITAPVQLWHGELDVNVPVSMGRNLAQRIPKCIARFYPDEGHFSLPFGRITQIVRELITSDL